MCPDCGKPMIVLEFRGIEVDACLDCGGTWLDAGELELMAELAGTAPGALSEALQSAVPIQRDKRRCPRCIRHMQFINLGRGTPIEIDRCPLGHGLWFDRGELQSIIAEYCSSPDAEAQNAAQFFAELFHADLKSASCD